MNITFPLNIVQKRVLEEHPIENSNNEMFIKFAVFHMLPLMFHQTCIIFNF